MTTQRTPTALGTEKIGTLLMQYSVPAIIAMTASSLYNMVDSIFIGHGVGSMAISGLAITFPLMNLAAAFGSLVGAGAATLISVKLGQKDYDTAQSIGQRSSAQYYNRHLLYFTYVAVFRSHTLLLCASEQTIGYARDFMQIILAGNIVTHLYMGLNATLRAAGHPKKAMMATVSTVVINVLLAPLFIFVLGWGIRGAATATVLAQFLLCFGN
ncbi:MAG: MATE family efflux transporter [Bacteroides graminisolvens]